MSIRLRIHLRGGQTIEKTVTDWSLKKSPITGELLELRWEADGEDRMPYVRVDAIDCIERTGTGEETP